MLERTRNWLGPRRPWPWLLLALVLYTLGGFFLAPWLVERQLVSLSAERADLTTTVDNIDINPYTFTFTMEGLDVTDSDASPLLGLERVFINFELGSLVRRAWTFDEFHVTGLDVALERFSDGDTNVGAVAARWAATAEPEEEEPESQDDGEPVRLVIADLVVDSAAISLMDGVPETRFESRVESLNFTVQNLSTLPEENAGQDLTLTMGNGAMLSWSGTSSLNPLHSEGRVALEGAYPGLIHTYFQDQLPFDMSGGEVTVGLDYRVGAGADDSLSADITNMQFSMTDTVLTDPDGSELARFPALSLENGELRWPENTVSLDAVRLRGFAFQPVREPDGRINFLALLEQVTPAQEASGAPATDTAGTGEEGASWQVSVGELTLDEWLVSFDDRVPEQEVTVELGLNATLTDISSVPDSQMRLDSSVNVDSGGVLTLGGTLVALPELQFNGEVGLEDLELDVLQPYIQPFALISVDQGTLGADGEVAVSIDSQSFQGNASVSGLALTDQLQNESLFAIDRLQVNGIALEQAEETRLDVDEIRLESPYARVEIEEDGSTNIGRVLVSTEDGDAGDADDTDTGDDAAEDAPPMAVTVDAIRVETASADFSDMSLPLPFAVAMTDLGGDISSLSTRSEQPARIALEGQVGEFGMVTIGGALDPLAIEERTQVDLVFRNVDMPRMTPYVIRFAGREIDDGRLDVDLAYQIENAQMDGDNVVVMRDLVLGDRVSHPDAADLPLGIAVALLKDRDGVINLDVPVSGDINNPEFSLGRVIGGAITNVLTNIATSPFRFLSGLVGSEGEDLSVIEFAPGRSDVTPPQRQKLVDLAEALEQRPQLQLRVPPVYASQADQAALAELLLDRRIESRLAGSDGPDQEDMTAIARRIAVLEELLVADGLVVEEIPVADFDSEPTFSDGEEPTTLAMLQLLHMVPAAETGEARLDEPAYADTLRRRLLEQQSVPSGELEALARQRAEQVLAVITGSSPELEQQASMGESLVVSPGEEGQIGMTLELEATD
ncbi:MAG: DUF748 domain-containing protein [Pseudomonadota bacterium]